MAHSESIDLNYLGPAHSFSERARVRFVFSGRAHATLRRNWTDAADTPSHTASNIDGEVFVGLARWLSP